MTSGVLAPMRHHATPLSETLTTQIAHVRSFSCVSQPVNSEGGRPGERLQAYFTLIRSFPGVLAKMKLQRVLRGEILTALGAQVSLRMQGDVIT